MKLATGAALLLTSAALVACGSSAANDRAAILEVVQANAVNADSPHGKEYDVRLSKRNPHYAIAHEQYTTPGRQLREATWFLQHEGSGWHVTWEGGDLFPTCSAGPAKVRRELIGTVACYPPVGVSTSIAWTEGTSVRLRYCQRPGGPGNFLAASKGVTCRTAAIVAHALEWPCSTRSQCVVGAFRCVEYYNGRFRGGPFEIYHHALCTSGRRRIEWDGG